MKNESFYLPLFSGSKDSKLKVYFSNLPDRPSSVFPREDSVVVGNQAKLDFKSGFTKKSSRLWTKGSFKVLPSVST